MPGPYAHIITFVAVAPPGGGGSAGGSNPPPANDVVDFEVPATVPFVPGTATEIPIIALFRDGSRGDLPPGWTIQNSNYVSPDRRGTDVSTIGNSKIRFNAPANFPIGAAVQFQVVLQTV